MILKLADSITVGAKDGKDGTNGKDGHIGVNGKDGTAIAIDGKDGISIKGDPGQNGSAGVSITGPKGANGTNGIDGKVGIAGKDGADAVSISGKDGVGHIGLTGPAGTNGKDGKSIDISVKNGYNGQNGTNGAAGVDGNDGITRIVYEDKTGEHQVATLDDGMKYSGDSGNQLKMKLNSNVNIKGGATEYASGNNISVVSDGTNTLNLKLAKNVDLGTDGTIKAGKAEMGKQTVTNTKKTEETGNYVTGLDNRTWDKDNIVFGRAATEDQLKEAIEHVNNVSSGHTEVTVEGGTVAGTTDYTGNNLKLKVTTDADGKKTYDLKLNDTITVGGKDGKDGTNGKDGHVGVKGADGVSGVGIDGKDGISITGKDGKDGVSIYGRDGTNGTDGHIGLTGHDGLDGKDGKDGVSADIRVVKGQDGVDGKDGSDGTTRIVYNDGKDGKDGKDHELATLDDGMKYSGDIGDQLKMKLNSNVNIKGGATEYSTKDNIAVVANGKDTLNLRLAKDISGLNSVTSNTFRAGDMTNNYTEITSGGITIKNGDDEKKNISITNKGINMGGQQIHNVAPGTAGNDVATVSQITNAEGRISKLNTRLNRVGAGAAALAALHPQDFDPDDKWDIAAGYGNYRDANAAAVGAFYHPNEDTMISIGGSVGGGENMVNAGISVKLGQGNHVTTSRVAMAREILEMKQKMEKLEAQNEYLMNRLGAAPEGTLKDVNFPDVPKDHWAYQYVKTLADKGYITGYPDGTFKGDRAMTRYEYAAVIYRALQNGAPVDEKMAKVLDEFEPELDHIQKAARFRVDRISGKDEDRGKVERVRVNNDQEERDVYGGKIPKALKK